MRCKRNNITDQKSTTLFPSSLIGLKEENVILWLFYTFKVIVNNNRYFRNIQNTKSCYLSEELIQATKRFILYNSVELLLYKNSNKSMVIWHRKVVCFYLSRIPIQATKYKPIVSSMVLH